MSISSFCLFVCLFVCLPRGSFLLFLGGIYPLAVSASVSLYISFSFLSFFFLFSFWPEID